MIMYDAERSKSRRAVLLPVLHRQHNGEGGSLARLIGHFQLAAQLRDDVLRQRSNLPNSLNLLADQMPVFPYCRRCRHCRGSRQKIHGKHFVTVSVNVDSSHHHPDFSSVLHGTAAGPVGRGLVGRIGVLSYERYETSKCGVSMRTCPW